MTGICSGQRSYRVRILWKSVERIANSSRIPNGQLHRPPIRPFSTVCRLLQHTSQIFLPHTHNTKSPPTETGYRHRPPVAKRSCGTEPASPVQHPREHRVRQASTRNLRCIRRRSVAMAIFVRFDARRSVLGVARRPKRDLG